MLLSPRSRLVAGVFILSIPITARAAVDIEANGGEDLIAEAIGDTAEEQGTVPAADEIVVTATRSGSAIETLPVSVSVVDEETLNAQLRQNRNLISALESAVPGLSIQAGEDRTSCRTQLRSRNVAFQINGVPVNEDLRSGSCTAPFALTPFAIERVEVVRGGTALYGAGAPGGIVNLITRRASGSALEIDAVAQTSFNTDTAKDTFFTDLYAGAGHDLGSFDFYVGAGFTSGGRPRSATGRPTYAAAFEAIDLVGAFGLELAGGELRLTATFHDEDKGRENYPDGTFDPVTGITNVVEVAPHPQVDEAGDRSATAALSYTHPEVLGHSLALSLFWQDQRIVQRDNFYTAEFGDDFFASNRENARLGLRSTASRRYALGGGELVTSYGLDFTHNSFFRFTVDPAGEDRITGYITPDFYLDTLAPFAQVEYSLGPVTVTGGVRHEWYSGAITREGFDPALPRAATPGDFADSELTLWNLGAVFRVATGVQLYGGFSQGAELSQLGRAARGARDPGAISNEPATSDQFEIGLRGRRGPVGFGLAAYYSHSDSSSQIQPDPSCAGESFCPLIPLRIPERAWGFEANADWAVTQAFDLSAVLTIQRGEVEDQDTGEFISYSTDRAVPLRATLRADWRPLAGLELGAQVTHYGASAYFTPTEEAVGFVDSEAVTLASASIGYTFGPVTLYAAADNLLDEEYVLPSAQATGAGFTDYEAPGRRVTVGLRGRF
ncbi:TonB-dependent receptor [Qipengyuania sediminis]|uniref:TonB-dependent receptor n=1 Tax=Qipengyuania sediminis TaxID=1532023 RepID=UPI0010593776|nr:TonB-dependent receptor [Qipengyuania sediminis]